MTSDTSASAAFAVGSAGAASLIYAGAATMVATSETATAKPTLLGNFRGGSQPSSHLRQAVLVGDGLPGPARQCARHRVTCADTASHFPVLLRPAIGVAPVRLQSVRRGLTGRRVDDGEVAHDADLYILRLQFHSGGPLA